MRRLSKAGVKPAKAKRHGRVKRRGKPSRHSSTADLQEQLALRTQELSQALEQQIATADVLKVISRSTFDLQTVLDTLTESAARLCNAEMAAIAREKDAAFYYATSYGFPADYLEFVKGIPHPVNRGSVIGRTMIERQAVQISDVLSDPEYAYSESQKKGGYRTMIGVPLLREGIPIGVLLLARSSVRPFTPKQIELVSTFADQAVIAIENVRLFEELQIKTTEIQQSLEYQTAISDVLNVISRSPNTLQPVLDTIVRTAARLCSAEFSVVFRLHDGKCYIAAGNARTDFIDFLKEHPIIPTRASCTGRAVLERRTVHVLDALTDAEYAMPDYQVVANNRTMLGVPLLREGMPLGTITLWKTRVEPFTKNQIELITTFADQAVIAIENTRLFEAEQQRTRELTESLERQTATTEVLRVISNSPGDMQSVFQAMLENGVRACGAKFGVLFRFESGMFHPTAMLDVPPAFAKVLIRQGAFAPKPGQLFGRLCEAKRVIQVEDRATESHDSPSAKYGGARSAIAVPMLNADELIGAFFIYRTEVQPFTDKQIELVQNFAAQAVIAIENTRLLSELRESLQQQTATADVLKVISRSTFDLHTVLDTLTASAARLCGADRGSIMQRDGDVYKLASNYGFSREAELYALDHPLVPDRGSVTGRAALEGRAIHIPDVLADPEYDASGYQKAFVYRTILGVPLLREETTIGVFVLTHDEVNPFTEKQIELVTTFADQAVIAMENARLLNELRESLEQQTATSKVLDVISRSAFDLQAVFETVVESSVRLCGADRAFIFRFDSELLRMAVAFNYVSREWKEYLAQHPTRPGRDSAAGRAALDRRTVHIPDVQADHEYTFGAKNVEKVRTVLAVPILKGEELLGVVVIYHLEVRPFTDKQIALVETFADQAAIAIDNARLLDELRHRTDELGRSVSELQALGEVSQAVNSTLDLQTVLSTIVAKAVRLSGTEAGAIYAYDEQWREFRLRATYGMDQELIDALTQRHIDLDDPNIAEIFAHREPTQVADLREEPASELNNIVLRAGFRARMVAPLLRGEDIVGMLVVRRRTPGEFPKNTVDIIKTFAAQSALAIQNARLFHEIEDKSRQLAEASQHKSQFLANMSHELRTPLNAILGYTELMADGAYGEPSEKMLGILKRLEANGKHLLGLINDVLDLSKIEAGQLVLELSDYSIQDIAQTVRSTLEPLAADKKLGFKVEVAPRLPSGHGDGRRLTQVLINLVGNAIKFTDAGEVAIKAEAHNGSFHVAVRDTGPGISAADQAKLFQEFQQADNAITRKKGGTGLGLAITKRIIEMHGGRIWVESQPGEGSTFAFTLPVVVEQQSNAEPK
jgi:GAF domain-containing protein